MRTALSAEERDRRKAERRAIKQRRSIAIHEAGHAIVAVGLALGIEHAALSVEGLPEGTTGGRIRFALDTPVPTPDAEIHLCCAGYIAEQISGSAKVSRRSLRICEMFYARGTGLRGDMQDAQELALRVYPTDRLADRAIKEAWERTERWLRRPRQWAAVKELADVLESSWVVPGGEIYAIAEKHGVSVRDRALLPARRRFFIGEAA